MTAPKARSASTKRAPAKKSPANNQAHDDEQPQVEPLAPVHPLPDGVAVVIFGASGDLASRKILPALANLARRGALPPGFACVGVARTPMDDEAFRELARQAGPDAGPRWSELVGKFRYVTGEYAHPDTFDALKDVLDDLDDTAGTAGNRVYYLATIPEVFSEVAEAIGAEKLNRPKHSDGSVRLVIEKPFGRDLASATALDTSLHRYFDEKQIYRIDHYLGKETVQNLLALRFANAIFEPIWNRRYVDHVEITVAEDLGVEHRGGFYETAGALRDIVQNHVMQVLALTLMEPPASVDAEGIRDEKVKALRAVECFEPGLVPGHVIRGQYDAGTVNSQAVVGYRQEEAVSATSTTETFVAMRLKVDNWRWAGVPFYIRTGKRLAGRLTEIAMTFQRVPHLPFAGNLSRELGPNNLILRIQPDEGISLGFGAKVPGQALKVRTVSMDFSYRSTFSEAAPDAYERLLLDAMVGDPTLFIRTDEVDQAWHIVDPVLEAFAENTLPLARYAAGTWGPKEADRLTEADGNSWRTP
ncbi:MAG: glucose-6-phosphate dehydrogenase [Acidimicrobiales bacterium]